MTIKLKIEHYDHNAKRVIAPKADNGKDRLVGMVLRLTNGRWVPCEPTTEKRLTEGTFETPRGALEWFQKREPGSTK